MIKQSAYGTEPWRLVENRLDLDLLAQSEQDAGLELLVETARMWRSLGHRDAAGKFRIEGVTGPDEYSAVKDNNVYTNLMAQRNMACAADAAARLPLAAKALGVTTEEAASWRDAAAAMYIPFDERVGIQLGERASEHDIPKVKAGPRPAQPARRAPDSQPTN